MVLQGLGGIGRQGTGSEVTIPSAPVRLRRQAECPRREKRWERVCGGQ